MHKQSVSDVDFLIFHLNTGMETAELAFHVKRFRKSFDYISFRQLDADAVGICVSVVDVNGIGALRHRRNTEFFSEHIGGDKQTVARFMPVLIAGGSVVEGDRRIGLLALADLQVLSIGLDGCGLSVC